MNFQQKKSIFLEDSELIWKENILKWFSIRFRRFWVDLSKKYFFGFENFSVSTEKKFSWKKNSKKKFLLYVLEDADLI